MLFVIEGKLRMYLKKYGLILQLYFFSVVIFIEWELGN